MLSIDTLFEQQKQKYSLTLIEVVFESGVSFMKIQRPSIRSAGNKKSHSKKGIGKQTGVGKVEAVEEVDVVDEVDRFEVSNQQNQEPEEDVPSEEMEAIMAELLADPAAFRATTWPALIGLDKVSPEVEATVTGVMALIDSEGD